MKTGPFLNQHDVDYIGEGKFSIFGNDNVEGSKFTDKRLVQEYSSIYIYDMLTDNVLKKLELKSARISINTQGRLDVLENGNYFIDDGQRALILDSKGYGNGKKHKKETNGLLQCVISLDEFLT